MVSACRTASSTSASVSRPCVEGALHGLHGGSAVGVVGGEAVHSRLQGRGVGLRERVVVVLRAHQVVRVERVGDVEQGLVGPAADALADVGADRRRPAVDQVVRRHHAGRGVRLDRHPERHVVVLVQQPRAEVGGGGGAVDLVVVAEVVLERGRGHQVGRVVTAHAARVAVAIVPVRKRVLGVALLVAAPAGVAQRVDHRRPEVQSPRVRVLRVVAAGLVADRGADPLQQVGVPGAAQPDRLREDRRPRRSPRHRRCWGRSSRRPRAAPRCRS